MEADLILFNGTLITMEPELPVAEAMAIQKGRIVWIGNNRDVVAYQGPHTEMLDLHGSFAYPGFIDTHAHIIYSGHFWRSLQLAETTSKKGLLEKLKTHLLKCQEGQWVYGVGWDEGKWEEKVSIHASDLDQVAPNHPIALARADSHLLWVNSHALKLAGIDASTPDPEGGKIERDSEGNPTGLLWDRALFLVRKLLPVPDFKETVQLAQEVFQKSLSLGITMIHNASSFGIDLEVFKFLAAENKLPLRIYMLSSVQDKEGNVAFPSRCETFGPMLQQRCVKLFADGAFGSRGAALVEPYQDEPTHRGILIWKEPDFLKVLAHAKKEGFQVAVHAIGDQANHFVLDAFEKTDVKGLRWRIEHAQLLLPSDIPRFAKLGVIAAVQPLHATEDMSWFADRVGERRLEEGAFMWRALLDTGATVVGGSDAPIVSINPLWGIYAAITRQDHKGQPEGGWYPKQRVTPMEALEMYTSKAAYACFQENDVGTLKVGKWADLVVLPENILTCEPKKLLDMKVEYTVVGGVVAYK